MSRILNRSPLYRPRPAINGLALDAWIIFDIAVTPLVTGLRRLAAALFGLYLIQAVVERRLTQVGAALVITGIVCTVAAYALVTVHFYIGRRIHFRVPVRVKMTS